MPHDCLLLRGRLCAKLPCELPGVGMSRGTPSSVHRHSRCMEIPLKECMSCCCCDEDSMTNCRKPDISSPCDHLPHTLKTFLHSFYPPLFPYCSLLVILTCLPVHCPARLDLVSHLAVDPLLQAPSHTSVKNKRR